MHKTYLEVEDLVDDPRDPVDVAKMQADAMRDILGVDLYRALESRAAKAPEPDRMMGQLTAYKYLMARYDSYRKLVIPTWLPSGILLLMVALVIWIIWRWK